MRSPFEGLIAPPLNEYLQTIGASVFRYDGFNWFETMLTVMACHNASFSENAFANIEYGHEAAKRTSNVLGVRFCRNTSGEKVYVVNNDGPDEATISWLTARNFANPGVKTGMTLLVELQDLRVGDDWRSRLHGSTPIRECRLEDVLSLGGKKILATDWRAAVIGQLMGMQAVLLSGPIVPSWADRMLRTSPRTQIIQVVDRSPGARCPCQSADKCHQRFGDVKPCVLKAPVGFSTIWGN